MLSEISNINSNAALLIPFTNIHALEEELNSLRGEF
jgi:hypothetical protein